MGRGAIAAGAVVAMGVGVGLLVAGGPGDRGQGAPQARARVSYLSVTGPATTANALPFLGSLIVRGCAVIVAAGGPERAAVLADARQYPVVRFVILGAAGKVPPNVDAIAFQTTGTRSAVARAVQADVG